MRGREKIRPSGEFRHQLTDPRLLKRDNKTGKNQGGKNCRRLEGGLTSFQFKITTCQVQFQGPHSCIPLDDGLLRPSTVALFHIPHLN